jgi:glyoxylase-like metal-dependent hydrolase (beta-lactamase superfamily II)
MYIADGIWLVDHLQASNVYIVATDGGAAIVDTGVKGSSPAILNTLHHAGFTPQQVRVLVITHAHTDHIGSLAELQHATGAPICASPGETAAIEGHRPLPHPPGVHGLVFSTISELTRPQPVAVQHLLQPGGTIPHLPGWRVIGTPGHTPDHVSFYHPEREFLLAGDAVVRMLGLRRSPWIFTSHMPSARASVALLAGLPLRSAAWGHGEPIIDDPTLDSQLAQIARGDRYRASSARAINLKRD